MNSKLKSLRIKIKHKINRFKGLDSINTLEQMSLLNMIPFKSFDQFIERKEPDVFKKWQAWLIIIYLSAVVCMLSIGIYFNEPSIYLYIGIPTHIYMTGNPRIILLFVTSLVIAGIMVRILVLIFSLKNEIEAFHIFKSLRSNSKGLLNSHYHNKLCWQFEILGHYFCKDALILYTILTFLINLALILHSYLYLDKSKSTCFTMWIFLIISTSTVFYTGNSFTIGFNTYLLTLTYFKYRFKQVEDRINKTIPLSIYAPALREHDSICSQFFKNNIVMNKALFLLYYIFSPILDYLIYCTIYLDSPLLLKLTLIISSIVGSFLLFMSAYSSSQLTSSAHSPYSKLISLIANPKRRINYFGKHKIVLRIERFAYSYISVYCHDLFPLNSYEFYLFVATVVSNFFLLTKYIIKFSRVYIILNSVTF